MCYIRLFHYTNTEAANRQSCPLIRTNKKWVRLGALVILGAGRTMTAPTQMTQSIVLNFLSNKLLHFSPSIVGN